MKEDERRCGEAHGARERGSSELLPPPLTLRPTEGTERETRLRCSPTAPAERCVGGVDGPHIRLARGLWKDEWGHSG